jgi:signal transduction histidine kinase
MPSLPTVDLEDAKISESFVLWARELVRERIQATALLMTVIFLLALLLELALANEQVQAGRGSLWHSVLVALCGMCWLTMRTLPLARRYPVFVAAPWYFLAAIVGGIYLSAMGGFDGPFFYAVYAVAPLVAYLPCTLPQRIFLTIGMVVGFSVAFLAPHPDYLRYSLIHIPATYLVLGSAGSIALGQLGYKLIREHYAMSQLLMRRNESLVERVEQTSAVVGTLIETLDATRKAERTQIARALHDELGQLIVGARMKISNLERRFHKYGPKPSSLELTSDLESLAALMDELNQSSRDLLSELRTKDTGNLGDRIRALVQPLAGHEGLSVSVSVQLPEQALPSALEETVYRTVQEALTNVVKHAGRCDVTATIDVQEADGASEIVVVVQDTGAGFAPAAVPEGASWGLVGMRERVEEVRGTLSITSGGAGTEISARLPLPKGVALT